MSDRSPKLITIRLRPGQTLSEHPKYARAIRKGRDVEHVISIARPDGSIDCILMVHDARRE